MIGKTISHYKILDKLGAGGMGVVYRAEDLSLGRQVAVKLLSPHLISDPKARRRFLHEAKAAAALDHPGICAIYDAGETEGQLFIAMALLEGQTLQERIAAGPLPIAESLEIAMQVAGALQEAHGKGIVHRDIKPGNIMLLPRGQAKVMDFGLAQLAGATQLTRTGMTLGTVAYMSPEQARGEGVDERTDIWSLGVVLYEMASGRLPFRGEYEPAVQYAILHEEPEPLAGLRPGVAPELEILVGKCLRKNPTERYQRADEVLEDLKRLHRESSRGPTRAQTVSAKKPASLPASSATAVQILGDRYRIERLLGRGGMGEVWLAFDLKLRVEVALKFLLPELSSDPQRIALLRREVRSARNVASPHVCRVFDLIEIEGQELVSMEYVDGTTLQELLATQSPIDIVEARRVATQLLTGIQDIHNAGLIHRDLKPANVMITRSGRAVVMDFGLAKGVADTQTVAVAGTPAYMAPEQMRGEELDARADLHAVGMILAEMVAPEGVRDPAIRRKLWDGLRQDPPKAPPGPWEGAIRRAVAANRGERFASAAEMARALGDTGQRLSGIEELSPYPGLSTFTGDQAKFFFGREMDVESIWRKISRLSLAALIGPSGVGKSSFLRAGVIAAKPEGWNVVICTPGDAPFTALGQSLSSEFAGQPEAMRDLFRLNDIERSIPLLHGWRQRGKQALLIVDQFEELFTLSPPEVQSRFAELLGRLSVEADIHVLVSMRDDFFFLCHQYTALRPLFSEPTPLGPLSARDLRRAIVEPAHLCGFAFEDDALVDEMMAEVEGERGALPLVAFAAARLWDLRDREHGVISRRSYEEIGRVGGALAQHAEATLERIGHEREDIVREIFRNLVTAQRTRVVRERDELLSVFEDRTAAEEVLKALIDARLLTSFEIAEAREGSKERRRIEIVHESLLTSWPRLVRWQTQDTDGAQLRDQLRQAAQLWRERHESEDLLWTGTAYKEFELWQGRYPGGLTETEEAFGAAMVTRDRHRRRRRRIALVSSFAALLIVLGIFGTLWLRSEKMTKISEARRLHMLAEKTLETDNTLSLALATASLEREDNPAVRRTALKALWKGPTRFVLSVTDTLVSAYSAMLSPDGRWLATVHGDGVLLWPRDGGEPLPLLSDPTPVHYRTNGLDFHPKGHLLVALSGPANLAAGPQRRRVTVWSVPDGRRLRTWERPSGSPGRGFLRGDPAQVLFAEFKGQQPFHWWRYSMDRDEPEDLGRADANEGYTWFAVDPTGRFLVDWKGKEVRLFSLDSLHTARPILVGTHDQDVFGVAIDDDRGDCIASADKMGEVRVWSRKEDGRYELVLKQQTDARGANQVALDRAASRVVYRTNAMRQLALLDLALPEAEPTLLLPAKYWFPGGTSFTPDDSWIVFPCYGSNDSPEISFYPLVKRHPQVLHVFPQDIGLPADSPSRIGPLRFISGGSRLVGWRIPEMFLSDVFGAKPGCKLLWRHPSGRTIIGITEQAVAADQLDRFLLATSLVNGEAYLIPLDGSAPRALGGFQGIIGGVALSPDGRWAAVGAVEFDERDVVPESDQGVIRIWDLETGDVEILRSGGKAGFNAFWFLPGERLVSSSREGLLLWDLNTGKHEALSKREHYGGSLDAERRHLVVATPLGATLWDLEERTERILPIPDDITNMLKISPNGRFVVAGMVGGEVWVLPLDEKEPHVLLGHEGDVSAVWGGVTAVWISPESDRIFTAAKDGTVRIWDVPQGRPLHNLPLDELLATLRAQTNLRVVVDAKAENGYRIEYHKFPGWETAPTW